MEQRENFEQAVEQYSFLVYRLAFSYVKNRHDADDIFQEVFLRYLKKMPRFESEEHRKAWLIRVTANCAKKFFRSASRKRNLPVDETAASSQREDIWLEEALDKLPPNDRAVLHLFYFEDLSVRDICRILNRRESTVRTQLTRARRKLKEILKEDDDA